MAQAYSIFFLIALTVAVLAVPLLNKPLALPRGLAVLAGFAGVVIALQPRATDSVLGLGHLAAFAAALTGALNSLILRRTSGVEAPGVILPYPAAFRLAVMAPAMFWLWQPMPAAHWRLTALMGLFFFLGGLLMVAALALAPAVYVAPMQYSQVLWAALFGWFLFDKAISPATALGIAVIAGAGLFILPWRQGQAQSRPGFARQPTGIGWGSDGAGRGPASGRGCLARRSALAPARRPDRVSRHGTRPVGHRARTKGLFPAMDNERTGPKPGRCARSGRGGKGPPARDPGRICIPAG